MAPRAAARVRRAGPSVYRNGVASLRMAAEPLTPEQLRESRLRIERLARLLDECFTVPGTRWRIGVEPLLGLVPVVGDFAGLLIGGVFINEALRCGAPPALIRRMVANLAIDAAVGVVPVAGDLFDFAFKAHRRNARLLAAHLDPLPGGAAPVTQPSTTTLVAAGLALLALLAAAGYLLMQL